MSPDEIREWAEMLASIEVGVAAIDVQGQITHWNSAMSRLTGYGAGAAVGASAVQLGERLGVAARAREVVAALTAGRDLDGDLRLLRPEGRTVHVRMVAHVLRDHSGQPERMVVAAGRAQPDGLELADLREEIARLRSSIERRPAGLPPVPGLATLTRREREITEFVCEGLRVPTIAQRLGVSHSTVRNHLSSAFGKLGVRSQAELVALLTPSASLSDDSLTSREWLAGAAERYTALRNPGDTV